MITLACGDQKILLVVILRKLVTKDWVHMSPRVVSGDGGGGWGAVEIA